MPTPSGRPDQVTGVTRFHGSTYIPRTHPGVAKCADTRVHFAEEGSTSACRERPIGTRGSAEPASRYPDLEAGRTERRASGDEQVRKSCAGLSRFHSGACTRPPTWWLVLSEGGCPGEAMPARLLFLCLLSRSSWLTVEGDRHVGAAGVLPSGRTSRGCASWRGWWRFEPGVSDRDLEPSDTAPVGR